MSDEILQKLTEEVQETRGVMQSATVLINGFQQRLADGIAAARAGDFALLTALEADLETGKTELAAAVAANSPAPA